MANEKGLINPNILLEWLDNIDAVNPQIRRDGIAHKYINTDTVREMIYKTMPGVDAVEVVRCKNCAFYEENEAAHTTLCRRGLERLFARPDGFCSYGERRKDNV